MTDSLRGISSSASSIHGKGPNTSVSLLIFISYFDCTISMFSYV